MTIAVLVAAFGGLVPTLARATQVRELSLADMARRAGPIFAGRVIAVEEAESHGLPVTRVTFQVSDRVRGAAGETTTLTFPGGGRAGEIMRKVPGIPDFAVGDDLLMLVYPPSDLGFSAPVGLSQGALRVRGADGGPPRAGAGFTVDMPARRGAGWSTVGGAATPAAGGGSGLGSGGVADAAGAGSLPYDEVMNRLRALTGAAPVAAPAPRNAVGAESDAASSELEAAAAARGAGRQK